MFISCQNLCRGSTDVFNQVPHQDLKESVSTTWQLVLGFFCDEKGDIAKNVVRPYLVKRTKTKNCLHATSQVHVAHMPHMKQD